MGKTCKLKAVSFQCMTKFTTNLKKKKNKYTMTLGDSSLEGRNKEAYLNVKTFDTACSIRSWSILEDITAMFQFSSVAQLCLALCDPMDYSMPGFPVHHQLLELAQPHVHPDSDAIQPSHPLLSPFPPAFNLSQNQGFSPRSWFFASGGHNIGVSASAPVIPMNIQD